MWQFLLETAHQHILCYETGTYTWIARYTLLDYEQISIETATHSLANLDILFYSVLIRSLEVKLWAGKVTR